MKKSLIATGAICLMLVAAMPALGQGQTTPPGPVKEGPPGFIQFTEGCTAIPDDLYDGSIGSMACFTVPGVGAIVDDVDVLLGIDHTWVGDLTIKVVSPMGTVGTLMSRPGFAEPADDGTGCCGDSDDISSGFPVTFDDDSVNDAELMGAPGGVVCQVDGICDYFSNPDSAAGSGLVDFIGEDATGDWMVCVGDSAGGDAGQICEAELFIEGGGVPTVPWQGIVILLAILSAISLVVMRRRARS